MVKVPTFPKTKIKTIAQKISATTAVPMIIALTVTTTGVVSVWAANLIGTSGPDTLVGTDNDDNIIGRGGNDRISDGLGSDKISAGSGDDTVQLEGVGDDQQGVGFDQVLGESGRDNIDGSQSDSFVVIYGGDNDDTLISGGSPEGDNKGKVFGGSGNDQIGSGGDSIYSAWGGPGDDEFDGASECLLRQTYGESGNDRIIGAARFASGGSGNDFISFTDCIGVGYGDSGNDELRGQAESTAEVHGGSGDDILFVGDRAFGEGDNDTLTGDSAANFFSCGPGIDTITNFNPAEGDTKTADCENF